MKLFIDNDQTLADFNARVQDVLGMSFSEHQALYKAKKTWLALRDYRSPEGWGFFESLDLMPDAHILLDGTKHIDRTILTGCPFGNWAPAQKQRWRERVVPDIPMITCMAADKHLHMEAGDILIDDREQHRDAWEQAGGIWITHTSAQSSLDQLRIIAPHWF